MFHYPLLYLRIACPITTIADRTKSTTGSASTICACRYGDTNHASYSSTRTSKNSFIPVKPPSFYKEQNCPKDN